MKLTQAQTIALLRKALITLTDAATEAHSLLATFDECVADPRYNYLCQAIGEGEDALSGTPPPPAKVRKLKANQDLELILADCDAIVEDASDIASDEPTYPQSHQSMAADCMERAKAIAAAAKRLA
jgi:hypothetical protein